MRNDCGLFMPQFSYADFLCPRVVMGVYYKLVEDLDMRDILFEYGKYIMLGICALDLLITLGLGGAIFKTGRFVTFLCFLLGLGITFDALMLASGWLAESVSSLEILGTLHSYRFLVHGAVLPLLIVISFYALEPTAGGKALAWLIGLVFIAAGVAAAWFTVTERTELAGLVWLTASSDTPAWARIVFIALPIACAVFLLLAGIALVSTRKNVSLIFAAILGIVPAIVAIVTGNSDFTFIFNALSELLVLLFVRIYCGSLKKD